MKSPFTFLDGASEKEQELHKTESTNTREILGRTCLRLGHSIIKQNMRPSSPHYFCLVFFKKNNDAFY